MPGGGLGARAVDHVADRALVGLPLSAVSPIFLRNLEAFERRLLARVEALELFCLAYGQPEFNDDDAEADQRLLEIDDLAVSAHPVFLGGKTLDPLDEDTPVPASVEHREVALVGDVSPEAPEVGLRPL